MIERIALWSTISILAILSAVLLYELMGTQEQLATLEKSFQNRQAEVDSRFVTVHDVSTYLESELFRTQSQLSIETLNLRASMDEQAAELKAETENLKEAAQSLATSLNEETRARIDSGENIVKQLSYIQSETDIDLDIERLVQSVVLVACEVGEGNFTQGSGTFVDASGILITNAHVIDPQKTFSFNEGRLCVVGVTDSELEPPVYKYTAEVVNLDHDEDISTLRVSGGVNGHNPPDSFVHLSYPTCATMNPALNNEVFIVGYPIIGQSTFTITNGIVSGFLDGDIKTSAKIDEGNSGGAAVNTLGEFIGIPTYSVAGELDSLAYVIDLRKRQCQSSI